MSKKGKVKKMLFVITIWVLCKKGGVPKNMGAIEWGSGNNLERKL